MLQTEFPFQLPLGYVDAEGTLHREGTMRLATAFDEIAPLKDPRVQSNPGYLLVILLSRVVRTLGTLEQINPKTIEGLYAGDLAFLQSMYQRVNESGQDTVRTQCPHCDKPFMVELSPVGGVWRYPVERLCEEVAYVAYHFHWPPDDILHLEHRERMRWVEEISRINRRLNDAVAD